MFNRIHQKLGTAGFIISIVALVAALGGGAYAASGGLSGKQKKEVEKIAKRYAGKPGANGTNGATGPAGAKGDTGTKGDAGAPGVNGTNGTNGTPGAPGQTGFTDTLPAGKTETGAWSIDASTAGQLNTFATISFPIPLSAGSPEGAAFVFNGEQTANEEFGTSGCSGTVAEPTAPTGVLCVYTQVEGGEQGHLIIESRDFGGDFSAYGPTGAYLSGPSLVGTPAAPKSVEAAGTWAVTAPTS
jgi:hypothetical protein